MASTRFVNRIEAREAEELPRVHLHRSRLDAARENISITEDTADLAEVACEDIEAAWRAGDETTPALDYAVAQAEATRTRALHTGAKNRAARLARGLTSTDKAAALAVADVIADAMPGVTVVPTFLPTSEELPKATDLPVVVVSQSEPAERRADGSFSGTVDLTYFRGPLYSGLNGHSLELAAARLGMRVEVAHLSTSNDESRDTARVAVVHGHLRLPEIMTVADASVSRLPFAFGNWIADECRALGSPVRLDAERQVFETSHVLVAPGEAKVISDEVSAEGVRSLVVEASVSVTTVQPLSSGATVNDRVRNVVEDCEGTFFTGLGRCDAAVLVATTDLDRPAPATAPAGPEDASRDGYTQAVTYVLRATCSSTARRESIAA